MVSRCVPIYITGQHAWEPTRVDWHCHMIVQATPLMSPFLLLLPLRPRAWFFFKKKALSLYCNSKERQVHGFFKVSKNPIQGSLVPSHIRHWAIRTRRRMRGKLLPWHCPSPLRMCFHNPSMYWVPPTTSRILPFGKVTVCGMVYLGSSHLPCLSFFFWWTTHVCTQPST